MNPDKRHKVFLFLLSGYHRLLFLFLFISVISACAVKPNQRELQRLENAREAAESAESQLESLKKERLQLEAELAAQKKAVEQKKKELEDAKSRVP